MAVPLPNNYLALATNLVIIKNGASYEASALNVITSTEKREVTIVGLLLVRPPWLISFTGFDKKVKIYKGKLYQKPYK